ncbi:MAG: rRNA maturation RNase YbeY [Ignavibacteriota bacterium]
MPSPATPKFDFSCSITDAASKKYPRWKSFTPLFELAAHEVLIAELPKIKEMKLGIVLMTDAELLKMNREVLKHDYYTDILTFEIERDEVKVEAELYCSLDRASENARLNNVTLRNELARLAIHGMLHLAGYDDKKPAAVKKMREKENFFLEYLHSEKSIEY